MNDKNYSKISVTQCAKLFMNLEQKENFGSKIHKFIENFLNNGQIPTVNSEEEKKVFLHFKEFLNDHPFYEFLYSEKEIKYTYKKKIITGKIDAVFKNTNNPNEYIIIDWKIMRDLDFNSNKTYMYIMNLYSKMLQKHLGENIKIKMFLVLLHQSRISYILKPCQESKLSLEQLLDSAYKHY